MSQSQSILVPVLVGVPPICLPARDVDVESDDEFSDVSEHPADVRDIVENNVVINEMSNNEVVNSVVVNNTAVDIKVVKTGVVTNEGRLLRRGLALLNVLRAYPLPPSYEWSSFSR